MIRSGLGSMLVVLTLLCGAGAASPLLHQWLHGKHGAVPGGHGKTESHCVVSLFGHGKVYLGTAGVILPAAAPAACSFLLPFSPGPAAAPPSLWPFPCGPPRGA